MPPQQPRIVAALTADDCNAAGGNRKGAAQNFGARLHCKQIE
jgi:hypothetical protein